MMTGTSQALPSDRGVRVPFRHRSRWADPSVGARRSARIGSWCRETSNIDSVNFPRRLDRTCRRCTGIWGGTVSQQDRGASHERCGLFMAGAVTSSRLLSPLVSRTFAMTDASHTIRSLMPDLFRSHSLRRWQRAAKSLRFAVRTGVYRLRLTTLRVSESWLREHAVAEAKRQGM